ncbi:hypothetical protein J5X84_37615 [Streptosporangiaceae bacterium NEAU-GS5]|nr:hypothetical protein [Streptosporangiaceae bacterium NEAU-GS5]
MTIDRLRDAARAVGETITDVPPLELGTRTKRVWLVPIAAAASVAVAVAAGTMIAKGGNGISQVAASTAGPVAPPKFFASVDRTGIIVQAVSGAATTATVPQPNAQERFTFIQAAQDNRLFYAASDTDDCHPRFYQFTLDENGQVTGFGVLPFAPAEGFRPLSMAVSGDGRKLAYGAVPCKPEEKTPPNLVVTDTGTGESRSWTSDDHGVPVDLTLTADGSRAAFRLAPLLWKVIAAASPAPMPAEVPSPIVSKTVTLEPDPAAKATIDKLEEQKKRAAASEGPGVKDVPPVDIATGGCAHAGVAISGEKPGVVFSKEKPNAPVPVPSDIPPGQPSDLPSPLPSDLPATVPSDLPSDLPAAVPSDVLPPLPSGEASAYASAEPSAAPSGAGEAYTSSVTIAGVGPFWKGCADVSDVRILDTNAAGGALGQAAKVTLPTSYDGVSGGVASVRLSPDGTRLIGSLGTFGVRVVDDKVTYDGSSALVAFDATDGKPIETLYKDDSKGGLMLIDLDGSGQSALVSRLNEVGVVDASGYHTITAAPISANDQVKKAVALIGAESSW